LKAQPYLVRLNRYVLEMATKRRLQSVDAVAEAARDMQGEGVEIVCITLGADGAVLVDADNSYHCTAPRIHLQSTVGCGDALVAGLITAARKGQGSVEMLRLGVLCGSGTAAHPGTELFSREDLDRMAEELEVTSLDV
jgi:6-phosphofructokinase 2